MRNTVVPTYLAAALLAAAPWLPVFDDMLLQGGWCGCQSPGAPFDTTLSFVDIARGSRDVAAIGLSVPSQAEDLRSFHAMFVASEWERIDGRPECVGAAVMAAAAVGLALARRARYAWVLGLVLAGTATWTWFRMRADLYESVGWPADRESARIWHWILPWPWLMVGAAAGLLGVAAWRARRPPRAPPIARRVFE